MNRETLNQAFEQTNQKLDKYKQSLVKELVPQCFSQDEEFLINIIADNGFSSLQGQAAYAVLSGRDLEEEYILQEVLSKFPDMGE